MAVKILVIEDNQDILDIMDYLLNDGGYDVVSSSESTIIDQLDVIKPDLVVLDELLANARGSDLCISIKSKEATRHIPVMLVSAHPHIRSYAEGCGADAYLEKPFEIVDFLDTVKNLTS